MELLLAVMKHGGKKSNSLHKRLSFPGHRSRIFTSDNKTIRYLSSDYIEQA